MVLQKQKLRKLGRNLACQPNTEDVKTNCLKSFSVRTEKEMCADVTVVTLANVTFIVKETFWYLGSSSQLARLFVRKTRPSRDFVKLRLV